MAESESRIVMIAVDASAQADEAFEWYLTNMARDSDDVKVVNCAEFHLDLSVGINYDEKQIAQITEQVKKQQNEVDSLKSKFVDKLRGKIKGEAFILTGKKPGEAIIEAAETHKANLIICGTRGLGKIRRTFMGSVSDFIVQHARCPVVVVRK
ncbi:universal stress protein in QAH/OAS sulfhydrylase 3'region-like isoform X8 [Mytilus trossulus]|uniref:universal stress protein in QAH/OAS sulfhydrylase 3'region-like isoform X7 n=1 Tax=Mytilus trossulus TaxID=6551 RepID=UPI0030054EE5